jgi:transcriptional regulator with XRE-family HTH domain
VKRRPTISDLAERAGVSVATVDRVLNRRHSVREMTVRRVLNAAEELGYHATGLLQQRLQEQVPEVTLAFLLQKRADHFYQTLGADLVAATRKASDIRGRPIVEFIDELAPATIVETMRAVGEKADAIAVVAVDHPHITEEIGRLHAKDVPGSTPARPDGARRGLSHGCRSGQARLGSSSAATAILDRNWPRSVSDLIFASLLPSSSCWNRSSILMMRGSPMTLRWLC